jgi:hypothetical protein
MSQKDKANMLRQSRIKQQMQQEKSLVTPQTNNISNNNNLNNALTNLQLEKQSTSLSLASSINSQAQSNSQVTLTTGKKSKVK